MIESKTITTGVKEAARARRQRAWRRFRHHRRGYYSLLLFLVVFVLSLFAEVLSNDKPLLVHFEGKFYLPFLYTYPETTFGGTFATETRYRDRFIIEKFREDGNYAVFPLNPHSFSSINRDIDGPVPSPPGSNNFLGTDDRGRDVLARLLYGFRVSVLFGLTLTLIGTVAGIIAGAIQGFFGGKIDLVAQRFIEIWSAMPELYLLKRYCWCCCRCSAGWACRITSGLSFSGAGTWST